MPEPILIPLPQPQGDGDPGISLVIQDPTTPGIMERLKGTLSNYNADWCPRCRVSVSVGDKWYHLRQGGSEVQHKTCRTRLERAQVKIIPLTAIPPINPDRAGKETVLLMIEDTITAAQLKRTRLRADLALPADPTPEWLDLLRILEWAGDRTHYICPDPACKQAREAGHVKECRIARLIAQHEHPTGKLS